ncbi:hypothetical protein ACFE33_15200 (plasmid) [Falsihalocynthiibacter sp. SS001]|uniref:hypothetical protein n=1 Tax=Falsihalocynthiibacter sp. SS001 TaxID=3349698 RepID=UPI0036D31A33
MIVKRHTGPQASVMKYDFLTALGAFALAEGKASQRMCLRFMTLITARYNWGRDSLQVGQREIARLWSVDERTVKREMAKLRALGWLVVRRQGARGRVTDYRLDIEAVMKATKPQWQAVGPDFEARMQTEKQLDPKVVPLQAKTTVEAPEITADEWGVAKAILHREHASIYGAWIQALLRETRDGDVLKLKAPTAFHATYVNQRLRKVILDVCRSVDAEIRDVVAIS